ncbi:MAG: ATP-binding protein [Clostridiales bacterium]|nr:ATP-binding protein [Clostridiales bacterium]
MHIGDLSRIDLTTSDFSLVIENNLLFVDKSLFIEHFLNETQQVQIIARPRRLGKSMNLLMLHCFLTDSVDYRPLFGNLAIRQSPVWGKAHGSPSFMLDFKGLNAALYKRQIQLMVNEYSAIYASDPRCPQYYRDLYNEYRPEGKSTPDAIKNLTKMARAVTGKRSYVLIDEYDKLLIDIIGTKEYTEVRDYLTQVLSAAMKGNMCLEKGLLTGVMRVSHEGMLSGLNNPQTYDVFEDSVYTGDYGLTKDEVDELCGAADLDTESMRLWYNGIKIDNQEVYNTFSVMSAMRKKKYSGYWSKSGTMDLISSLSSATQKNALISLLVPGTELSVKIDDRVSPAALQAGLSDEALYSLLVQSGYLALTKMGRKSGTVRIPNKELEEAWSDFIFSAFFPNAASALQGIFSILEPDMVSRELEPYLLTMLDELSFHNVPSHVCKDGKRRTHEAFYHNAIFGVLKGGENDLKYDSLLSNRESGDGRYDVDMDLRGVCVIIEFKSGSEDEDLLKLAADAVDQIENKRYGFGSKLPVMGIGVSCCKKRCKVKGRWIAQNASITP